MLNEQTKHEIEADPTSVVLEAKSTGRSPKELGAYYTDATVADFLLRWAVVTGRETVLDPSFGGGVFLTAAAQRIRALGGDPSQQVFGIELDAPAYQLFAGRSVGDASVARLLHADFFEVAPDAMPQVDAVVGNPPFIRYQRFNGQVRQGALRRALEAGVRISSLTSSWAPFLVHAVQFVKPGGRLAMVAPAELTHAAYARPVLEYLRRAFATTRILTFARRLFPRLSEDTVLVLAAGRGAPSDSFLLSDLPDAAALVDCSDPMSDLPTATPLDAAAIGQGRDRLLHYIVPSRTRELYRELQVSPQVTRLGEQADIGIGYVTGDNDFFHVDRGTAARFDLPADFLRRAIRRGSEIRGLRFTGEDWKTLHEAGHANLLLHIPAQQQLPGSVQGYLDKGVPRGVPGRYKCRVRNPWYHVPHVYEADGLLSYMSGSTPKLASNEASVVAPNALLILRLYPLRSASSPSGLGLAALWQTSLTALSCELEGHSLGGGMLKLEPTEAGRVVIAAPDWESAALDELADELDHLLRAGKPEAVRERADALILQSGLGLSRTDVEELRQGWLALRARRLKR